MAVVSDGTTTMMGGNEWFWIVVLFLFGFGGNGGFGGWGGNAAAANLNGMLTRAEMSDGFNTNQILNNQNVTERMLADNAYNIRNDIGNHFSQSEQNAATRAASQVDRLYSLSGHIAEGFAGTNANISAGFAGVNASIAANRNNLDLAACGINRNIDALRYETAKQTCDIVNAIKEDGEATRAMFTANTIQELRDKLQDTRAALSNTIQTQQILGQVLPTPRPAYSVMSPYQTYNPTGCGCPNA